MKVLVIDDKIEFNNTLNNSEDLLYYLAGKKSDLKDVFNALLDIRKEVKFDFFVATSSSDGLNIAKNNNFGLDDIALVDIYLKENEGAEFVSRKIGEDCAIELLMVQNTNVLMISARIDDEAMVNVEAIIREYKRKCFFMYIYKKYGSREGDRCKLKDTMKFYFGKVYKSINCERYYQPIQSNKTFNLTLRKKPKIFLVYPWVLREQAERIDCSKIVDYEIYLYSKDEKAYMNWFEQKVFENILTSSFLIFDITQTNLNVFFELGIAMGLGKKFITVSGNQDKKSYLPNLLPQSSFIYNTDTLTKILKDHEETIFDESLAIKDRIVRNTTGSSYRISYFDYSVPSIKDLNDEVLCIWSNDEEKENYFIDLFDSFKAFKFKTEDITNSNFNDYIRNHINYKSLLLKISSFNLANYKKRNNDILEQMSILAGIFFALERPLKIIMPDKKCKDYFVDLGGSIHCANDKNNQWFSDFLQEVDNWPAGNV